MLQSDKSQSGSASGQSDDGRASELKGGFVRPAARPIIPIVITKALVIVMHASEEGGFVRKLLLQLYYART